MVDTNDTPPTIITVAFALPQRKINTFITPSLIIHAQKHAINFIQINPLTPLNSQLPFDILIHKLYHPNFEQNLLDFHTKYPNIPIIDNPSCISKLQHRDTMLQFIPDLDITLPIGILLGVPQQKLLDVDEEASTSEGSLDDLEFPMIAKPLVADGTPDSHKLSLVLNSAGLHKFKEQAQTPFILQQYINHGGVLFKVYVAGNHVKCVQRKSLPDFHLSDFTPAVIEEGIVPLLQLSNLPNTTKITQQEADVVVDMPPWEFVHNLATAVREATQLHLFNIDLIRDVSVTNGNRYLVVDINYFPGYAKLPEFEAMITNFLLDVVRKDAST